MIADVNLSRRSVLVKGAQIGAAVSAAIVAPVASKAVETLAGKEGPDAVPLAPSPSPASGATSQLF